MKKTVLACVALTSFIITYGQIPLPRDLKKNTQPVNPVLKDLTIKPLLLVNGVYYIGGNGFWAANIRERKVVTSACASAINEFRWKITPNADNTVTVTS